MTADPLEALGILVACGAAAAGLVVRDPRHRAAALGIALVVAPVLLAGDVWNDRRFIDLRDDPALFAGAIAACAVAIAAGAMLFRRLPWAFPLLAFAALPLRLPVQVGGETSNLLVPLYLVVAAGLVAHLALVVGEPMAGVGRMAREAAAVRWLRRLLAATLVLYGLQALFSEDVSNAIENACFFLVPFAVLLALLVEVRWTQRLLATVMVATAGIALAFAGVAFWEYAARDLIFNKDLLDSNQIHLYFRVNSLFHDPNVLGRYLALAIVALAATVAWTREGRLAGIALGVALVLLAALALSYSLTSFAALLAALVVLAALRFGIRWGAAGAATVLVAGALFIALGGTDRDDPGPDRGFGDVTSGRADLVSGGLELAGDRPLWGWGSGSFGRAFFREIQRAKTTTSHSEPITVVAEQGAIGAIVYLGLVGIALWVLFGAGAPSSWARATVAAGLVAILVHSMGYPGFLIDPVTWALLALGIALHPPSSEPAG
jgi:putative inorganic carbon (HCO3(-)) transporter